MGKIFDALEKSGRESGPSGLKTKEPLARIPSAVHGRKTVPLKPVSAAFKGEVDDNLVALVQPESVEAEQFKIIRSTLLFPDSGKPPRTIMVTSAVPGEGKTFISTNLAVSIAQSINQHVLLIDCDMRKPNVHSMFGFGETPGLSEYLARGIDLPSLLLKTGLEKLTLLPGGTPPHNPAELLSSDRMSALLEEAKQRYPDRYIVIDTPPPHLTAETNVIAKQVDAILLVVRYGSTRRELIEDLVEKVGRERILGVVFNRFETMPASRYGYGKYGYGSKYHSKKK